MDGGRTPVLVPWQVAFLRDAVVHVVRAVAALPADGAGAPVLVVAGVGARCVVLRACSGQRATHTYTCERTYSATLDYISV